MSECKKNSVFSKGDAVRLKSRPDRSGVITANPSCISSQYWYPIFFGPGRISRHPESDLEPDQLTTDVASIFRAQKFASRDAFTKLFTHLRLATAVRSQIYSMGSTKTDFLTYQFKPLLKFLDSRGHRLLIADEVGLGKTIEAGLILTELKKRGQLKRVLIVPPSHLVLKWRDEMRNRFQEDFNVISRTDIERFLTEFEDYGDETSLKGILSLQTLRSKSLIERWEAVSPNMNLVIFDEAGRLRNSDTLSNRAASNVIENSDAALLLTATPIQTGDRDLFNILQLLDPEEYDSYELFVARLKANEPILISLRTLRTTPVDIKFCLESLRKVEETPLSRRFIENPIYKDIIDRLSTSPDLTRKELIELQQDINSLSLMAHTVSRTRKIEVQEARPVRQAKVILVEPTEKEINFYNLVTLQCYLAYSSAEQGNIGRLVAVTRQRQVASCMPAMVNHYWTKIEELLSEIETSDFGIEDQEQENKEENITPSANGQDINIMLWKEALIKQDTKLIKFLDLLKELDLEEPNRKIVVFSYFKKTLAYLQEQLVSAGILCELISGDVPSDLFDPAADIRGQRINRFRSDPKIRVLLTTEVGGEGIDLQFCHILINYDLPWNPMVVEQRIGRLDRIGQLSDKILIFNLSMKGTIEDRILTRLYDRIKVFERSIGDLEAILGEQVQELVRDLFSRRLTPEEQEERIEKAANVILKRQIELEHFEEQTSALIGHDEFFIDQINQAKEYRRFIGGEELILYLGDFLKQHFKNCKLHQIDENVFMLDVNNDLKEFVRDHYEINDLSLRLFLLRSMNGSVTVTTSSKIASDNNQIEFLTFYHPLIVAITSYYSKHEEQLHPVSHVRLPTKNFKSGVYGWFLYLTDIGGARPAKDLFFVVVALNPLKVLHEDECDKFLVEMVTNAQMVAPGERGGFESSLEKLIEIADQTFIERLEKKLAQLRKANNALVSNQLASLEESYRRNVNRRQNLLEKARINKRQETYIKGLETGIKNLTLNFEKKRGEIEATRTINSGFDLKGAGIAEVIRGH